MSHGRLKIYDVPLAESRDNDEYSQGRETVVRASERGVEGKENPLNSPPVNYRATIMQMEDAYLSTHGSPLHVCSTCFSEVLQSIVQPMLEIAVSHGRQLQREEIVKGIMVSDGKNGS